MSAKNGLGLLRRFHEDERGEITTQQMIYLAVGAIVAAVLYKYGKTLLAYVKRFIDAIMGNDVDVEPVE